MIPPLHNKWTIMFYALLGPILTIPIAMLFTYSYQSTPSIWYCILIINLLIGILAIVILLIFHNARYFYFIRIFWSLCIALPFMYTTLIIMKFNFPDTYLQIFGLILLMIIVEWFLSFFHQKIRLSKALELGIPNNAINIDEGTVNLQTMFLFPQKMGINRGLKEF